MDKWNFPNCIGAVDGKHINIIPPPNSGSYYYNYKHYFSVVLLALVDADYRFVYVETGCNGRISDGGIVANSLLFHSLKNNNLNIPNTIPLPNRINPVPFTIVADDAFPLEEYIMKPYSRLNLHDLSKRIFNYRLSRARRRVENAFGLLANRFRIFQKFIHLSPEKVDRIVLACCVLHNYLSKHKFSKSKYMKNITEISISDNGGLTNLAKQTANTYTLTSKNIRTEFENYFVNEQAVPWQWNS